MSDGGLEPLTGGGLASLEARVRQDLEFLNFPPPAWIPARVTADGERVADVIVVGGGMCGLAAAFALRRRGITNLRILDRAAAGHEGPWLSHARMETLRSPKQLTGPASGLPSLTFRAWFTAQFGGVGWDALDKIPRPMWMDYLRWFRRVLALPVENCVEVARIGPDDGLIRLDLAGGARPAFTRRAILATGRDGTGRPSVPSFLDDKIRGTSWAHAADVIDFAQLKGKRVVVIGVGSAAMDNAAEALEHGAREVRLLARRTTMPRINKLMGVGHPGFVDGFAELDEVWRWRIMHYAAQSQTPAPHGSTLRVSRHANAFFHFDCAVCAVAAAGDGVRVTTAKGRLFDADFVIAATGFSIGVRHRPELAAVAGDIATWGDRVTAPAGCEDAELAGYPYLGPAFAFTERQQGRAPWLGRLHCFNHAASLSLGKISGDIPAISQGAARLAAGIASAFYAEDIEQHWRMLQAYEKPELIGHEWRDADA